MAESQDKRVNVIFSPDQFETLTRIAKKQNISLSDALRQAIKISDLVVEADQEPDSRVVLERGGRSQELKLIR